MPCNFMQKRLLALMERALFAMIPVFTVNHGESSIDAKFMLVHWNELGESPYKIYTCVIM